MRSGRMFSYSIAPMVMLPFTVPPSSTRSRAARTSPRTTPLPATRQPSACGHVSGHIAADLTLRPSTASPDGRRRLDVNIARRVDLTLGGPLDVEVAVDGERPVEDVARAQRHSLGACRAVPVTAAWNRRAASSTSVMFSMDVSSPSRPLLGAYRTDTGALRGVTRRATRSRWPAIARHVPAAATRLLS